MPLTLTEKIIQKHTNDKLIRGETIRLKIDHTLTQDATGTMTYLHLQAMNIEKVKTDLSVSYVDHNTLQTGFENADDHMFLQSIASKLGVLFSKAGNGICHQVHLERFSKPGITLLGSDSHTPTSGGIGALAIGAGGLDVACAMAGVPFSMIMPNIINIELVGSLRSGVAPKDIILYILSKLTVKGGVNKVLEYSGPGVATLSVPERSTITNMGAELGATSSIFPSDNNTLEFLKKQNREKDYQELKADDGCLYDEKIIVDLTTLSPLAACPSSPDNIKRIEELKDIKVNQVLIGSCTNSSYEDFIKVASILKGKKVHPDVSLGIAPGSKQVLMMITKSGILEVLLEAGARILETTCGACIGMGQAPNTNGVSLRTFNRNFYGRSGTTSASVYLVSPEVASLSAINGYISNPLGITMDAFEKPEKYLIDDNMIIKPKFQSDVYYGPNIMALPKFSKLKKIDNASVILKLEDNITTDHIMPAGANVLPYRSNIEKLSDFTFGTVDATFKEKCLKHSGGIIVARNNYGQGSSREHAAIAPRYLGIKAIMANSFARIHRQNLINFGILPLIFINDDYDKISCSDIIEIKYIEDIQENKDLIIYNKSTKETYKVSHQLTAIEIAIIKKGGLLNYIEEEIINE